MGMPTHMRHVSRAAVQSALLRCQRTSPNCRQQWRASLRQTFQVAFGGVIWEAS
eukprot:CAMPEP_0197876836 /NCGR_PEP_ID=MMETSP1439-20131203/5721_1 /TAXON_ID=66791 /ORGANISM="Gonyaulax spinifera, Strain CCMP409" /LENGTH=53 /DNA_ID=CAMNT_0043496143 /DNA_START=62 /DNA_END=223 /DNA_ORIENTATION=+